MSKSRSNYTSIQNLKRLGDELGQLFKKHSGGDKYVDAAELSTILNKGLMEGEGVSYNK